MAGLFCAQEALLSSPEHRLRLPLAELAGSTATAKAVLLPP
jgi:hypothetical protein